MESTTYIKNLRITPKKLRFLLSEIKSLKPTQTLAKLQYTTKSSARIFYKAIKSAITNAKNTLKVNENLLKFKVLSIEEGQKLKRWRAGGRGTVHHFKRKFSHIKISLISEEGPRLDIKKQKVVERPKVKTIKKPIKSKVQTKSYGAKSSS